MFMSNAGSFPVRFRLCLAGLCFTQLALAGDASSIYAPNFDFAKECRYAAKNLPPSINAMKRLPTFIDEKTVRTNNYNCSPAACTAHEINFSGFTLYLLETKDSDPYIVTATTFSTKARLFDKVYVGQSLEDFKREMQVSMPINRSPIKFDGDCLSFKIWHDGRYINKIQANCDCT